MPYMSTIFLELYSQCCPDRPMPTVSSVRFGVCRISNSLRFHLAEGFSRDAGFGAAASFPRCFSSSSRSFAISHCCLQVRMQKQ